MGESKVWFVTSIAVILADLAVVLAGMAVVLVGMAVVLTGIPVVLLHISGTRTVLCVDGGEVMQLSGNCVCVRLPGIPGC